MIHKNTGAHEMKPHRTITLLLQRPVWVLRGWLNLAVLVSVVGKVIDSRRGFHAEEVEWRRNVITVRENNNHGAEEEED